MKKTIVKLKNACLILPKNRGRNLAVLLLFILQGLFSLVTFGQTKNLQGHVVNEIGQPVQGATIKYKTNAARGAITDANGNFTISLPTAKNTLIISYVGYIDQQISVTPQSTTLNIIIQPAGTNQL